MFFRKKGDGTKEYRSCSAVESSIAGISLLLAHVSRVESVKTKSRPRKLQVLENQENTFIFTPSSGNPPHDPLNLVDPWTSKEHGPACMTRKGEARWISTEGEACVVIA
jgi:hypothetical protein